MNTPRAPPLTNSPPDDATDVPETQGASVDEAPARKKRGCIGCLGRIFLVLLVLSIPAAFILNGPGFRAIVKWGVGKGLAAIQRTGEFEVEGTLLSGVQIHHLTTAPLVPGAGDPAPEKRSPITELSVGKAEVRYEFGPIFDGDYLGALKLVGLKDVEATIDLPATGAVPEPAEEDAKKQPFTGLPDIVWQLLGTSYEIENINVRLLKDGSENLQVEGFFLKLPAHGEGELGFSQFKMGENIDQGPTRAPLRSTIDSLVLGRFEPIDRIAIDELSIFKAGTDILTAVVEAEGGTVFARYSRDGEIEAILRDGRLDLGALASRFGSEKALPSGLLEALDVHFVGDFSKPSTWDAAASFEVSGVTFPGEGIDSATFVATISAGKLEAKLDAERKGATAHLDVDADVSGAADTASLADIPAKLTLTLETPAVEKFFPPDGPPVTGGVALTASAKVAEKQFADLKADLSSQTLAYGGAKVDSITLGVSGATVEAFVIDLDIDIDEANHFAVDGTLGLETLSYHAEATGEIFANPRFAELLANFGFDKPLEVAAGFSWAGEGVLKPEEGTPQIHRGAAKVNAADIKFADGRPVENASVEADYAPGSIGLRSLDVRSGKLTITAEGTYENNTISIPTLGIREGEKQLVSGSIRLPYDPAVFADKGAVGFFQQEGEVEIDLTSAQFKMEEIAALAGSEFPLEGTVTATVAISGTPRQLGGGGNIQAYALKLTAAPDVPPGDLAMVFTLEDDRATVSGTFKHPKIETLAIDAAVPFRPAQWVAGESAITDEPLQASVKLPASSLEFVKGYVDGMESLAGTATIDMRVGGTVGRPEPTGSLAIEVDKFKMDNRLAPEVRDTVILLTAGALEAGGYEVKIGKFDALVSGGRITLGGGVSFPEGAEAPLLDLTISAREALVARNPDLNIRTNLDLTLSGPFTTAKLAGEIALTNSRYIKEVDILPIGLPTGRGRSDLPEIDKRPATDVPPSLEFGVDVEPFKDWEVDVKVVTRDPFLVRGNLARADAVSDLRVTGTLAKPVPSGRIYIAEGRLTLPFSKVDIQEGEVQFSENTGFNGKLNVQATASIRTYRITIYIYGPMLDPKHVLTCDPPLPEEDIISLLATGSTREELTGGSGTVAATKAAQLFFKKLKQDRVDPDNEPGFLQELDERTTLDIGQTDPRTGAKTIAGRIRLFRQFYLVANVNPEGEYRSLLKYIFKFR